ncbi:MAG: sodium:calcium antiporter [Candidatus Omnitrophica bacterium]|nr:sodium:calcium antiporter [Candidatus Omnitrophota bacterium]MBI2174649.1 sodium:calcium antiporter [Candidatus Omnitrophota bacterium]MBI3009365.1 sodium:calcium antiporter [Candidatus Omnitrophota bacterium]
MRPTLFNARRSLVRDWFLLVTALALIGQWILISAAGHEGLGVAAKTVLPGLAIFGAATLLSWGAELAQIEIAQSLALAGLALVAVLPEYAVDMYLAWKAAKDPAYTAYAAANMTGSNRLLIGMGWSAVLLAFWLRTRTPSIQLKPEQRLELVTLFVATCYAFLIPLKGTLSIIDTLVFFALFVLYIRAASRGHIEEPGLAGPPERLALLPRNWRRAVTVLLFLLPAYAIFISAEPFANGLLENARQLGIEEFILIQWLAPLASESPEFIVAIIFALRNNPTAGLGTLVSSKVNQWTLLIGMLPLVFSISGGHLQPMMLDGRQCEEIFLTAAQSILALVILANLSFGLGEALLLLSLFLLQFIFPTPAVRMLLGIGYLAIALVYLTQSSFRRSVVQLFQFNRHKP